MMIKSITAVAVGIAITTGLTLPVVAQTEADAMVFVRLVNRQLGSDNRYTKLVSNSGKVEDAMLFCKRLDEGYTGYILAQEILKKTLKIKDLDLLIYSSTIGLYAIPTVCPRHNNQFEPFKQTIIAGMDQFLCQNGETKYCKF